MNKTIGVIVGVIVLLLVGNGIYAFMNNRGGVTLYEEVEGNDPAVKDPTGMMGEENEMMKAGSYEAYAPEKLVRAETGDVVLFFHASWCPSCRGLNTDIEKNLETIPSDVSILKVDYDTESEMKKRYGVTYQHTLVQVDTDGNLIKKWSGSPTLSSLVSEIE
jgi:thiol-disulfide isomerase/thioredoxin